MRDRILPLIKSQPTVPIRVRDRQRKHLETVLTKLEKAVDEKGPNGEKSCSDMDVFLAPNDQLRSVCDINVLIIVLKNGFSWSEHIWLVRRLRSNRTNLIFFRSLANHRTSFCS